MVELRAATHLDVLVMQQTMLRKVRKALRPISLYNSAWFRAENKFLYLSLGSESISWHLGSPQSICPSASVGRRRRSPGAFARPLNSVFQWSTRVLNREINHSILPFPLSD